MEESLSIREQIELLEKLTQNTVEYRLNGKPKTEEDFIKEIVSKRDTDSQPQHYFPRSFQYK